MTKKIIFFVSVIFIAFFLTGCTSDNANTADVKQSENKTTLKNTVSADKIEVVHFHTTNQCWACITVGKYSLKTIQEKFPKEYEYGTITFHDINRELPENSDMVIKFQATGPSLFINAITDGKDNIQEDIDVWRYIANENQFVNYFENKINKLLGR